MIFRAPLLLARFTPVAAREPGMIGRTLSLYLAGRFARTVLAAFVFVFALIYAVDLVEMLRRSGDAPKATAPLMAVLSFLRTPTVAEQALPFAVLFGSMIAFSTCRASSNWSWRAPRASRSGRFSRRRSSSIALIGVGSVALYNPASAWMKQRSDEIENSVFGGRSNPWGDLWLRQKSVDGQAIIHARGKEARRDPAHRPRGVQLRRSGQFRRTGRRRLGGPARRLLGAARRQGRDAGVRDPAGLDLPARDEPEPRARSPRRSSRPKPCRSGGCPASPTQTAKAGLDPTAYRLKFQELLARPVLLAAMVLVAACFSLRFFRMGGVEVMVSGGVAAGFVLYVATKVINDLGEAGFISAVAAGWSPGARWVLVWRVCVAAPRGWLMGPAVSSSC